MSAATRLTKSNIGQSKNSKLAKTLTKFRYTPLTTEKSKKTDFQITHSTRFSDNLTIASKKSLAQIKQEKKYLAFLNYNNFHMKQILDKNKKNETLMKIYNLHEYTQNINNEKPKYFLNNIKLQKKFKNYNNTPSRNIKKPNLFIKNSSSEKNFLPINKNTNIIHRYTKTNDIISSCNYSKTSFNFFPKPLDMKHISNFTLYKGRNLETTDDKLAYPSFKSYVFSDDKREESVSEFRFKTRLIAKGNYLKKINNNNYGRKLEAIDYSITKQIMKENSIKKYVDLFKSFSSTKDEYNKYLLHVYSDLREKSESLTQQKLNLFMEIQRIKQKFNKYINILKECYSIKYFLTCVKNHTLLPEKFAKNDFEDLENDKLKFKPDYYSSKKYGGRMRSFSRKAAKNKTRGPLSKQKSKSMHKKVYKRQCTLNEENLENHSKNILMEKSSDKSISVFENMNSVDEFFDHLDRINTKMYNLLKENLDEQSSIVHLKQEYDITLKIYEKQQKVVSHIKKNIELCRKELNILKNKNNELIIRYDELKDNKFKRDCGIILVRKNIEKIYKNIKRNYEIEKLPNTNDATFNRGKFLLKLIEGFYLKMVDAVNEDKKNYPLKYIKFKSVLDKKKKIEASINFQKILAQKLQIKVDNVLKKASKIIFLNHRKTGNYMNYCRKKTKIKETTHDDDDKYLLFEEFNEDNEN